MIEPQPMIEPLLTAATPAAPEPAADATAATKLPPPPPATTAAATR